MTEKSRRWRERTAQRAQTTIVGAVAIGRCAVVTVELVPLPARTDVRIQFNGQSAAGILRPTPLRVTFASKHLARVLDLLGDAQRILSSAVPIALENHPSHDRTPRNGLPATHD